MCSPTEGSSTGGVGGMWRDSGGKEKGLLSIFLFIEKCPEIKECMNLLVYSCLSKPDEWHVLPQVPGTFCKTLDIFTLHFVHQQAWHFWTWRPKQLSNTLDTYVDWLEGQQIWGCVHYRAQDVWSSSEAVMNTSICTALGGQISPTQKQQQQQQQNLLIN